MHRQQYLAFLPQPPCSNVCGGAHVQAPRAFGPQFHQTSLQTCKGTSLDQPPRIWYVRNVTGAAGVTVLVPPAPIMLCNPVVEWLSEIVPFCNCFQPVPTTRLAQRGRITGPVTRAPSWHWCICGQRLELCCTPGLCHCSYNLARSWLAHPSKSKPLHHSRRGPRSPCEIPDHQNQLPRQCTNMTWTKILKCRVHIYCSPLTCHGAKSKRALRGTATRGARARVLVLWCARKSLGVL